MSIFKVRFRRHVLALTLALFAGIQGVKAQGACSPWSDVNIDIDPNRAVGSAVCTPNADGSVNFSQTGWGSGIPWGNLGGTVDGFNFAYRQFSGNFEITARVVDVTQNGPTQDGLTVYAGLMVRESLTPGSRHAYVFKHHHDAPDPRAHVRSRAWNDEKTWFGIPHSGTGFPYHLKLVRYEDQITLYVSASGTTWSWVDGTTLTDLASTVNVGIGLTSMSGYTATATLENVKVSALSLPYSTSWFGNSYPGGRTYIQQDISSMYVDPPTGKTYTNSFWDEGATEAGVYDSDGRLERGLEDTHGDGRLGGYAITKSGNHVFMGMVQTYPDTACDQSTCKKWGTEIPCDPPPVNYPACGVKWPAVRRYDLKGSPNWSGGEGYDGSMRVIPSTSAPSSDQVRGLAVGNGNELYVSDAGNNRVRVYNTLTMAPIRDFPVTRPRGIAVDANGNLWIIQAKNGATPGKVLKYFATGQKRPTEITAVDDPTAVIVAPNGRIWVADAGLAYQQIRIFNANGNLYSTFGDSSGIYGGVKGEVQPLKFNGPVGIGLDTAGNIYVGSDGPEVRNNGTPGTFQQGTGTELRKFTSSGSLLWESNGLEFLDAGDFDRTPDGVNLHSLFTKEARYSVDFSKPSGQESRYAAMTLDRNNKDDMRLHAKESQPSGVFIRRPTGPTGPRFLFVVSQLSDFLATYRFEPSSEIAVPCGLLMRSFPQQTSAWPPNLPQTGDPRFDKMLIWNDVNGNKQIDAAEYEANGTVASESIWGWYVDDSGDIWTAPFTQGTPVPIRRYIFQGPNSHGCPEYHRANSEEFAKPVSEFGTLANGTTDVLRAYYIPLTDTMYLGGYTLAHPKTDNEAFGEVGREVIRYNNWRTSPQLAWRISDLPYIPSLSGRQIAYSMGVTGSRVFVGIQGTPQEVREYDASCGELVRTRTPGPEVAGKSGWIDVTVGLNVFQRSNGENVVTTEDDFQGKGLLYRVPALNCLLCPESYCTGTEIGCTATGTCGCLGCCNYICGQPLPGCIDPDPPPVNRCQ